MHTSKLGGLKKNMIPSGVIKTDVDEILEIKSKIIKEKDIGGYVYAIKVKLRYRGDTVLRSGSKKYIKDLKVGDVIER